MKKGTRLTPQKCKEIRDSFQKTLTHALAPTYWKTLRRAYDQYTQFRRQWADTAGRMPPHDECAMLWATSQRLGGLSTSSTLQYLNNIAGALRRFEGYPLDSVQVLSDYRRALKRQGALKPKRQAQPATPQDIRRAIEREPRRLVQLLLGIMWRGAARVSDALRLDVKDVQPDPDNDVVNIRWTQSKSDPFRVGHITGITLQAGLRKILERRLRQAEKRKQTTLFPPSVGYRCATKAIKRARATLTTHSLRRGALTHLARKGVPLEEVRLLSRHATVDGVIRYVSAAENARARDTARISAKIDQ